MRPFLLSVLVLILSSSLQAQDRSFDPSVDVPFRTELQRELSHYKHGDFLYRRCDIFKKIIDRRIAATLGTLDVMEPADDVSLDTVLTSDVSKSASDENETSIAISRGDPNTIVAGANDASMYSVGMPIYYSSNAGGSWRTYRMPALHIGTCVPGGDPMLAAGPDSMLYYAYLIYDNDASAGNAGISDIILARSTDGRIWTHGRPVVNKLAPEVTFEDKESIAVDMDPSSPYYGRIYLVWVHYEDSFGRESQTIAWSDDHGDSWSNPVRISDSTGYFSTVRVGAHGFVYISSSSINNEQLHSLMVSGDGGHSFTRKVITDYESYPTNVDARPGLKGIRGFRAFPYTSFDVDRATGTVYLAYCTYEDTSAAIYAVTSSNNGSTWSTPSMIGREGLTDLDHFLPWVTVDQERQTARVAFYSSEEDPSNRYARFSVVGFNALTNVQPLGADLFNPLSVTKSGGPFIGDYVGADAFNGYYAASWTENRRGHNDGDVFASIESPLSGWPARSVSKINAISYAVGEAYPSPATGPVVSFTVTTDVPKQFELTLYDLAGHELSRLRQSIDAGTQSLRLTLPGLTAGAYRVVFNSGGEALERTFLFGVR